MVARTALAVSRNAGLAASVGMGAGGVVFAFAALLGLHAVFVAVPWAYTALRVVGGAYLVYLGVIIWRGAAQPLRMEADDGSGVAAIAEGDRLLRGIVGRRRNHFGASLEPRFGVSRLTAVGQRVGRSVRHVCARGD